MNVESAFLISETTGSKATPSAVAFHADLERLSMPSEPPASGRSDAVTRTYDAAGDTPAPASFTSRTPDWCVDAGAAMLTMTTFELWEALERGHVLASMRVWREGMECWTPVAEIPEFAWCAGRTPEPPREHRADREAAPDVGAGQTTPPPESCTRPASRAGSGGAWVVVGSAVAVVAVSMAMFVRVGETTPAASMAGAAPAHMELAPRAEAAREAVAVDVVVRHGGPGQQRLPRDGRRAHGR